MTLTRRSLAYLFAGAGLSQAGVKALKDRKVAPPFALKDAAGNTVKLADYKGKVVLLNFWATWCGPCKLEIPWFVEMETRLKSKGLSVIGVAMDEEGWELVKPHAEKLKINYKVLLGNEEVAQAYGGVDSLPMSFILDRAGRVASVHTGLVSKSVYEEDIQELLKAK